MLAKDSETPILRPAREAQLKEHSSYNGIPIGLGHRRYSGALAGVRQDFADSCRVARYPNAGQVPFAGGLSLRDESLARSS